MRISSAPNSRHNLRGASPVEPQHHILESMFTRLDLLALVAAATALQPPPSLSKGGTSLKFDAADAMADMIAAQHALKLESVRKAKEEVYASYAEKIAALEQELAARTEVPIYSSHAEAAPAAPPPPRSRWARPCAGRAPARAPRSSRRRTRRPPPWPCARSRA